MSNPIERNGDPCSFSHTSCVCTYSWQIPATSKSCSEKMENQGHFHQVQSLCVPSMPIQRKENLSLSSGFLQVYKRNAAAGVARNPIRHKVWWTSYKNSNYRDVTLRRCGPIQSGSISHRTRCKLTYLSAHHFSFASKTDEFCERRALSLDGTLRVKMMIILNHNWKCPTLENVKSIPDGMSSSTLIFWFSFRRSKRKCDSRRPWGVGATKNRLFVYS